MLQAAGRNRLPRRPGAQAAFRRTRLAALFVACFFPRGSLEKVVGRRAHDDTRRHRDHHLFQRQHRRSQGRDAHALQRRLERRAAQPGLHAACRAIASSASCRSFTRSGSPARCACRLAVGIGVVFHPNPLDARAIGALVSKHAVTLLLATPTFLQRLHAPLRAGGFRQPALRDGRRGETARAHLAGVRRSLRHPPAGRLRLHGVLAGGDREHRRFPRGVLPAGGRQARQHRPPAAGNQRADR